MAWDVTQPVDGTSVDKSKIRDNWSALDAAVGSLIAEAASPGLAGNSKALAVFDSASPPTGPLPIDVVQEALGFWRPIAQLLLRQLSLERVQPTITAGAVSLDMASGTGFDVSLTANINSDGITITGAQTQGVAAIAVRLKQDATGSRTIGATSTVNAGFASANFDFGGRTITLPSAANQWVQISISRWSSSEKWNVREVMSSV